MRNGTHLVVPIVFGSVGAAFGVTTVFLSNAAILLTSGFLMRKADIPASDLQRPEVSWFVVTIDG